MKQARPPLPGVVVRVDRLSAGAGCHGCANVKRAKRPAAQRYSAMASSVNRARGHRRQSLALRALTAWTAAYFFWLAGRTWVAAAGAAGAAAAGGALAVT